MEVQQGTGQSWFLSRTMECHTVSSHHERWHYCEYREGILSRLLNVCVCSLSRTLSFLISSSTRAVEVEADCDEECIQVLSNSSYLRSHLTSNLPFWGSNLAVDPSYWCCWLLKSDGRVEAPLGGSRDGGALRGHGNRNPGDDLAESSHIPIQKRNPTETNCHKFIHEIESRIQNPTSSQDFDLSHHSLVPA